MSTWEERMSERAQVRIRAEREREHARQEAEWAAEEAERQARLEPQRRAMQEEGPPGGCRECWHLGGSKFGFLCWFHGDSVQPGPLPAGDDGVRPPWMPPASESDWCYHACHGEDAPWCCIPVGMASSG